MPDLTDDDWAAIEARRAANPDYALFTDDQVAQLHARQQELNTPAVQKMRADGLLCTGIFNAYVATMASPDPEVKANGEMAWRMARATDGRSATEDGEPCGLKAWARQRRL